MRNLTYDATITSKTLVKAQVIGFPPTQQFIALRHCKSLTTKRLKQMLGQALGVAWGKIDVDEVNQTFTSPHAAGTYTVSQIEHIKDNKNPYGIRLEPQDLSKL